MSPIQSTLGLVFSFPTGYSLQIVDFDDLAGFDGPFGCQTEHGAIASHVPVGKGPFVRIDAVKQFGQGPCVALVAVGRVLGGPFDRDRDQGRAWL